MGRKSREKRERSRSAPPTPQEAKKKNRWGLVVVIAVAIIGVALVGYHAHERKVDNSLSTPRQTVSSRRPVHAPPLGFYTSAVSGSPYEPDRYFHKDFKRWLYEYLDQHPNRELALRLKGYFESGQAELGFETKAFFEMQRGKIMVSQARAHHDRGKQVPKMIFDTIMFDRRYTTVQSAFRTLEHEGYHLDRVVGGKVPLESLSRMPGDPPPTTSDVRLHYEEEVEATRRECDLSKDRPGYVQPNDICLGYWQSGIQSIRDQVASVYTKELWGYVMHRDYVLELAKNPNAR